MLGSLIGSAISTAGNIATTAMNNSAAKDMAAHAVQTRVKDLRRAGLNPILAATNGGLQAASVPALQQTDIAGPISSGVNSAINAKNADTNKANSDTSTRVADSNIALQNSQSAKNLADADVSRGQLGVQLATRDLLAQQIMSEASRRANLDASTGLASANAVRTRLQTVEDRVKADYLNTPTGAESARFSIDNKTGGLPGIVNSTSSYIDRLLPRVSSSAKSVRKSSGEGSRPFKPNPYQSQMRGQYDYGRAR